MTQRKTGFCFLYKKVFEFEKKSTMSSKVFVKRFKTYIVVTNFHTVLRQVCARIGAIFCVTKRQ